MEVPNIRIAILHHALGRFGGGEKLTLLHAIYLAKYGYNVELFYDGPLNPEWKNRTLLHLTMKKLPSGIPRSIKDMQKIIGLIKYLGSFDRILVHHHICPLLAYYLSIFLKSKILWYCGEPLRALWENWLSNMDYREISCTVKPTSTIFYGRTLTSIFLSDILYDASIYVLRAVDKTTIRRYLKIVANSHYTKKIIRRIYDFKKPIEVIYPGVELFRKQLNASDDNRQEVKDPFILAVGSMIPMKNYFTLLKAFKHLEKRNPSINLVIIGSGPLEKDIRKFARDLDLKNIIFKRKVSEQELSKYYENCLFTVHIALNEPFGLVPVEAAIHGKPSIVSNNGGVSEFITNWENGLTVNPRDPKDVANAMNTLIENENLTLEMGRKAREKALNNFTIEKSVRNLINTIKKVQV